MTINLHIERLILDGLPVQARYGPAIQASLESELRRLLEDRGLAGLASGAHPHLSAAPIHLAADGQPTQWGRQIAHSLFAGLVPAPVRPAPRKASGPITPHATFGPRHVQNAVSPQPPMESRSHER